jgi:dTMP kinase
LGTDVSAAEELAWFVEDRREHVARVIEPALAAGRTVLCDRYFLSTVAYQGARGLDWRELLAHSEAEFPIPDLVLLLEIEPAIGLARTRARGGAAEGLFEDEARLERVAALFAALDRSYIRRVDARPPPDVVQREILALVRAAGLA